MGQRFAELMFSPAAKALQARAGSRTAYARFERQDAPAQDRFGLRERDFIAARDSFYLATVGAGGWPYVQHRGGEPGFLKILDDQSLGFADYRGNKQFVTFGNLATNNRVSMFLMDYPNRRRLKLLGRARLVDDAGEAVLARNILGEEPPGVGAVMVSVEAFDWNCPQYITPRYTEAELEPLQAKLAALEAEVARLTAQRE